MDDNCISISYLAYGNESINYLFISMDADEPISSYQDLQCIANMYSLYQYMRLKATANKTNMHSDWY